jgi:hypothetical protein
MIRLAASGNVDGFKGAEEGIRLDMSTNRRSPSMLAGNPPRQDILAELYELLDPLLALSSALLLRIRPDAGSARSSTGRISLPGRRSESRHEGDDEAFKRVAR